MNRFRLLLLLMVLWLIFVYNLERPDFEFIGMTNIDLDTGVYIITGLISIAILMLPDLAKRNEIVLIPTIIVYFVSRAVVGDPVNEAPISLTVTELAVLILTVVVVRKISLVIADFESTVENVLLKPEDLVILPKEEGEEKINNELSRARYFDHMVGFLLVQMSAVETHNNAGGARFDLEGALQRRFLQLRVAQVVRSMLPKISILVWDEENLVVCLPETGYAATEQLARAIHTKLAIHLNLTIPMGIAVFPKDGLIYHDVVQATLRNMLDFGSPNTPPDNGQQPPQEPEKANTVNAVVSEQETSSWVTAVTYQLQTVWNPWPQIRALSLKAAGTDPADPNFWLNELPYQSMTSRTIYQVFKRVFDIFIVVVSLPLVVPLMGGIALGIKMTDGGSIFFRQQRTGLGGRTFKMYKFRSMVENAEELLKELAARGLAKLDENGKLAEPLKLDPDPRITRIGRFLRKTSLDELPQILNVLSGDMSLVGPRPTSWGLNSYLLRHTERLNVRPGITGLWQISARGNTDFDVWLQWDSAYIDRMSFILDMQILFRTAVKVFKKQGAR